MSHQDWPFAFGWTTTSGLVSSGYSWPPQDAALTGHSPSGNSSVVSSIA